MVTPETESEALLRNVVTAIASTLRPSAMIAGPVLSAILLKCAMPLPGAVLLPPPLLLPRSCLLLRSLRLLLLPGLLGTLDLLVLWLPLRSLLGPLRLLWLLSRGLLGPLLRWLLPRGLLGSLLLRLLPRSLLGPLRLRLLSRGLLSPLLLWLLPRDLLGPLRLWLLSRSLLGPLLLCGWPGALRLPARPALRLALILVPLLVLRVRRDDRTEEQKQGSGAGSSNELHSNPLC